MEKQQLLMKIAKKHYSSLYSDLNSDNESTGDKIFENLHLRGMLKRLFLNIPVIVLIVLVCVLLLFTYPQYVIYLVFVSLLYFYFFVFREPIEYLKNLRENNQRYIKEGQDLTKARSKIKKSLNKADGHKPRPYSLLSTENLGYMFNVEKEYEFQYLIYLVCKYGPNTFPQEDSVHEKLPYFYPPVHQRPVPKVKKNNSPASAGIVSQPDAQYSIVWQEFGKNSKIGNRFWQENKEGYLPFFIDGDDLINLQNKQPVKTDEIKLLKGILVAYKDESPFINIKESRYIFRDLLQKLMKSFNFPSFEKLILDTATLLRDQHGSYVSYKCLSTGTLLLPNSSKVKSDLIMDIWGILTENNPDNPHKALEEIIETYSRIKLEELLHDAVPMVIYIQFVALRFLNKFDELNHFIESDIYNKVSNNTIRQRMKYLLENKSAKLEEAFVWH